MQLSQHSHVVARMPINWDDGFHTDLKVYPGPDHARVYGPSGWRPTSVERCFHRKLHRRDEAIKRGPQSDVFHLALQINKAVLQRKSPFQVIGNSLSPNVRAGRERNANLAGRREWPENPERVRQIAKSFAEKKAGHNRAEA